MVESTTDNTSIKDKVRCKNLFFIKKYLLIQIGNIQSELIN